MWPFIEVGSAAVLYSLGNITLKVLEISKCITAMTKSLFTDPVLLSVITWALTVLKDFSKRLYIFKQATGPVSKDVMK